MANFQLLKPHLFYLLLIPFSVLFIDIPLLAERYFYFVTDTNLHKPLIWVPKLWAPKIYKTLKLILNSP